MVRDLLKDINKAGIYLLKVKNTNTRTRYGISLKLTINFEHVITSWELLTRL